MHNREYKKGYKGGNICILSDSLVAFKWLNNLQIDSQIIWDCCQSLVKLAEHDRVQLICVPGHMGIEGIEIVREGSSHSVIGPEPTLGILAKGY